MILIFSSAMFGVDPQIQLLVRRMNEKGVKHLLINPLSYHDLKKLTLEYNRGEIGLYYDGVKINVKRIYIARNLRLDCMIDIPEEIDCTTQLRSKAEAHLLELIYSIDPGLFFPGVYNNLVAGEQKCVLFKKAHEAGLLVPDRTVNSFDRPTEDSYRKSLGFPFTIAYSRKCKEEVAVTIFNRKARYSRKYGLPWQWQSVIKPIKQIRSIFVDGKMWAYFANEIQFKGKSLREAQDRNIIKWKRIYLPGKIERQLKFLISSMGLKYACPEFLLTKKGEYYFIDLNPCGDWYGFGSEKDSIEIADSIIAKLCE